MLESSSEIIGPERDHEVRRLHRDEWREAQRFYASVGYTALIKPIDDVFGIFQGQKVVGLVRISPEYGSLTLRGLQVSDGARGQGLGRKLMELVLREFKGKKIYLLETSDGQKFFEKFGFKVISIDETPEYLQKRLTEAERKNQSHDAMLLIS